LATERDQRIEAIFLSPHLDDAALSCGGQIFGMTRVGGQVLIVNLMAGLAPGGPLSTFAQEQHERWRLGEDAMALRRTEDAAAGAVLGAVTLHWDIPDCIYRRDPASGRPLYDSERALFGPVDPAEEGLLADLSRRMAGLPLARRVFVPLAAGQHVDHQLTRRAAESCPALPELVYYEDYPYVQRDPKSLEAALGDLGGWDYEVFPVSEKALAAKIAAIACYESQLPVLFGDRATMARLVQRQVAGSGGERIWLRKG
jgi:LmbE family N-acetylglucosaminyl deacetylase